jgi:5-(carboxyamino)imidazole ribonucleotide synthase
MSRTRVGVVGAGQLGRMLALAGYPLGIDCRFLDRDADSPGGQVGSIVVGALDDAAALARLASDVDVLTLEIENVSVAQLSTVRDRVSIFPPPAAISAHWAFPRHPSSPWRPTTTCTRRAARSAGRSS